MLEKMLIYLFIFTDINDLCVIQLNFFILPNIKKYKYYSLISNLLIFICYHFQYVHRLFQLMFHHSFQ